MPGWFRSRGERPARAIGAQLWKRATSSWLFMRGLEAAEVERLRALCERFLATKHFSGTHGLEISEVMQVEIAAQACILVLELGESWYEGWSEIIVYPSQFAPEREVVDEAGVVHLTNDPMAGEAWLGGPVILSYEDVAMTGDEELRVAGYNVVIHEFAHKLDMRNGDPSLTRSILGP
ncbi:MAG TPA: zinc-dependent peptidase, partial [Usitatibacter sp.]